MKKHLLLTITMIAAFLGSAVAQGTGTAADPYLINHLAGLQTLATCVNSGAGDFYYDPADGKFYATNASGRKHINANSSDVYYKLTTDITVNSGDVAGCGGDGTGFTEWTPIGNRFDRTYHFRCIHEIHGWRL